MLKRLRRRAFQAASASVAIGTASMFVLTAAGVSLMMDRAGTGPAGFGDGWLLRGTVAPGDGTARPAPRHAGASRTGATS